MEPSSVLAWTRGFERLAIVGLSGVSLVLGWDLFRRGILSEQSADFKAHGWSIRLQRVGPGIFFALFATAAFVSAIAHPLEITTGKKTEQGVATPTTSASIVTETESLKDAGNPINSTDRDLISAINTVLILMPNAKQGLDENHIAAIDKADRTLDSYKKSLMFQHFGQMSIQFYSIRDSIPGEPTLLQKQPPEFQAKYPEIEAWDKDTFLRTR